jgi:hypothetical protein
MDYRVWEDLSFELLFFRTAKKNIDDPLRRFAVPELGDSASL